MKKQHFLAIVISLLSVVLILGSLLFFTKMPNQQKNGFTRHWLIDVLTPQYQTTTALPINRITGSNQNHLFFSSMNPTWMLMTDTTLQTKDTLSFDLGGDNKLLANDIYIDGPNVYIYAHNISYFISGRTDTSTVDTTRLLTPLFSRSIRISPQLSIIRGLDSTQQQQVFKQINTTTGKTGQEATILENRNDGGFSTDGSLLYDSLTNKIVYVQLYQNRFFCLDSNLQVMYIGKTIDTCSTNQVSIEIVHTDNETKLMPSNARQTVNEYAVTNYGYLFVASGLRSDNESLANFNKNTVIDIYQINNGSYLGSFYIPNKQKNKCTSILVTNNQLIALYKGGHISTFHLSLPLTITANNLNLYKNQTVKNNKLY